MYTLRRRLAALARALTEAPNEVRVDVRTKCRAYLAVAEEDDDR